MQDSMQSRRSFVGSVAGAFAAFVGIPGARRLEYRQKQTASHPEPRPGIDASRVLEPEELGNDQDLISLYDGIREIPHIADGIRCFCGCADLEDFRSLLTCFESNGMALHCEACQTEGAMVVRLHKSGRTLDQIRRAVDARFGLR